MLNWFISIANDKVWLVTIVPYLSVEEMNILKTNGDDDETDNFEVYVF